MRRPRNDPSSRVFAQPDYATCGQTCLAAIYEAIGIPVGLDDVLASVEKSSDGGTLVFSLGLDALSRGLSARVVTCDVARFDPTWFDGSHLEKRIEKALRETEKTFFVDVPTIEALSSALEFCSSGGEIRLDLSMGTKTVAEALERGSVIAGVCLTSLYGVAREREDGIDDSERGLPIGHFVVVDSVTRDGVFLRDPLSDLTTPKLENPIAHDRFVASLVLGALTRDGCLLVVGRG